MARRRRSRLWISRLVILMLLILAGVVVFLVWDNYFRDKGEVVPEPEQTEEFEVAGGVVNEEDGVFEEEKVEKKPVVQYDGEDPNESDGITGVITYAGVSGDDLVIRLNIDQFLDSGECMLLLSTAGNVVYSNTASVIDAAATSSCDGFNVPMSLLEDGYYNIMVEVESGAKKGKINGEVNL